MDRKIKLKGHIEFNTGSVVSKTLKQNPAGSITLFAFDAGQALSEHSAPFDAVVQVIDGEGHFIIGGEEYVLNEGELIIIPANVPHAANARQKFKMMLIMLKA